MKIKLIAFCLSVSLFLTGCSFLDGSYLSIEPHREQRQSIQTGTIHAASYQDLVQALEQLIDSGAEMGVIVVQDYPAENIEEQMVTAADFVSQAYAIGAFAVEKIDLELGTSGGTAAIAVTIRYRRSLSEIESIRQVSNMDAAEKAIYQALERCDAGVVLLVDRYAYRDLTLTVQNYAVENPQVVMEVPIVTETTYGIGRQRVIELAFTYQNSRDALRQMQDQVQPVFNSAVLYVSGDGQAWQKYAQLYGFLMERFDYTIETSITPAYSLLRHGVGDSRAFATVYAAMCRSAGLECQVVTGTREGEPWTWNMITEGENHYHVDLLRCSQEGEFRRLTDAEMGGYVWDYSAYSEGEGPSQRTQEQGSGQ